MNILKRFFCEHDYRIVVRKDLKGGFFAQCQKCGKISKI